MMSLINVKLIIINNISICFSFILFRLFLREEELQQLLVQFSCSNLMDEKTELVVSFLTRIWAALEKEPMFAATNEEQRAEARYTIQMCVSCYEIHFRQAVERMVFSELYMMALYPNNEADVSRDQVLGQHIARVANFLTPNHRDLKISRRYQYECPWPAAQVKTHSSFFNL